MGKRGKGKKRGKGEIPGKGGAQNEDRPHGFQFLPFLCGTRDD